MNGFFRSTCFAFDFAAPMEGACTTLNYSYLLCSISSSTAHQVTTINTYWCIVALTSVRTKNSQSQILFTKSGRLLEVHQVLGCRRFMIRIVRLEWEFISVEETKRSIRIMKFIQRLLISYRFCFLWFCPVLWTEFVSLALFEFCAMFWFLLLLLVIWFSLLFLWLLLTWTRDAPSNRSLSESPITRKFGNRIQHVFTEQDPDIPWHLHSSRISAWTCCKKKEKWRLIIERSKLNLLQMH